MDFKALTDNEVNALAPHTFKYSIAIMQYYSKDKNYVGSGTLIQIASRFFIATAGHNLAGVPDKCLYMGYSKEKVYEQLPFISAGSLGSDQANHLIRRENHANSWAFSDLSLPFLGAKRWF